MHIRVSESFVSALKYPVSPSYTEPQLISKLKIMTVNIAHSGFIDLLDLVSTTTSRIGLTLANSRFYPEERYDTSTMGSRSPLADINKRGKAQPISGVRYEQTRARENVDPDDTRVTGRQIGAKDGGLRQRNEVKRGKEALKKTEGKMVGVRNGLKYRKVDKRSIGSPTDFR